MNGICIMCLSCGSGCDLSRSGSRDSSGAQARGESTTNASVLQSKNPVVQESAESLLIDVPMSYLLVRVVEWTIRPVVVHKAVMLQPTSSSHRSSL